MIYLIEINDKESYERGSYKQMKQIVNKKLKSKKIKKILVNGKEIKKPITKENWID